MLSFTGLVQPVLQYSSITVVFLMIPAIIAICFICTKCIKIIIISFLPSEIALKLQKLKEEQKLKKELELIPD